LVEDLGNERSNVASKGGTSERTTRTAPTRRFVYDFADGSREMAELLGGKGAGLAEMARVLARGLVPAGFTITTEACVAYLRDGGEPEGLDAEVDAGLARLESTVGRRLGDPANPLLVSVRSGARVSMPGMMDTVLNLGLNESSVEGLAARTGNPRFAWDCFRRLHQMFGSVVRGVPGALFEALIAQAKRARGLQSDTELATNDLRALVARFRALVEEVSSGALPENPRDQVRDAIRAVFESWNNPRAREYRRLEHIPDDWGTAVTVQQMVFGNTGPRSGSGVAFSRDEITGGPTPRGEILFDAQGEDVVSGVRNTNRLEDLAERFPEAHRELIDALRRLERHYRDMQDVEFTIEDGRLYLLQTRAAKRPAQAAVRFARDAVEEGLLSKPEALRTIPADGLETLLHPTFDPAAKYEVLARGVPASPGAARGAIAFSAAEALARAQRGEDVILVRPFTEADDVAGFHAARGVLTSEGGRASHAALVARAMGRPCVSGAEALEINPDCRRIEVNGRTLTEGDMVAIDGSAGTVTLDDVPFVEPSRSDELDTVLGWADERRRLRVRANADTPRDAERALQFGAEGIGLCRTEHMFFGDDREHLVRDVFVAAERWRRGRTEEVDVDEPIDADGASAERAFHAALAELKAIQRSDFEAILEAMAGHPVTVRLLDPPLHEFLSVQRHERELTAAEEAGAKAAEIAERRDRLAVVRGLSEANPMLGTRGARLGILYPPLFEMQVGALVEAASAVRRRGAEPAIEIMLPLIAYEGELAELRELVDRVASETVEATGVRVPYLIGTMVELPRACLVADRLARSSDFFSFGTNDLTQTAIGLSRDDVEGRFLGLYSDRGIIDRSPFETIDAPGVGELVRLGAERGLGTNPALKLGVCGEHGGDPTSIRFFDEIGLDYVSCSPTRIPVARLAAAQATLARNELDT
jgi:pyruvate,orthophosphate dikinase